MKSRSVFVFVLVSVLLAACSGVEMMPASQATSAPTTVQQPAQPAEPTRLVQTGQAPADVEPAQPVLRETPVKITFFDETPNPNPDDRVKIDGTRVGLPQPQPSLDPQPGDDRLTRGPAFLERVEVVTLESAPPQFALHLTGSTPTPCHHLRVKVDQPDAQKRIAVSVYSVANPEAICTQVLRLFEVSVPLGSYPSGTYTVQVNGQDAGQFTAP